MADATAPRAFHVMARPTGAVCNLACDYCFFLAKERLHPGSRSRMSEEVLEAHVRQVPEAHQVPQVTVACQGGEPTLMGLDFFRRAQGYIEKYRKPNTTVEPTIQTNGVLLDDEWCEFLQEHNYLVGVSVDGPREMHDAYRKDKAGKPVFDRVMRGLRPLQKQLRSRFVRAGRNDPCPCGSGRKFKRCHGREGRSRQPRTVVAVPWRQAANTSASTNDQTTEFPHLRLSPARHLS